MNLVDPEGRKIYFAKGVPEWFKERFAATIQYMNEKGTSWIFKKLQDSDNTYYIDYTEWKTKDDDIRYNNKKKTIYWDPNIFIESSEGIFIFPATILAHEGAHALQHEEYGDDKYQELVSTADEQYGKKCEREVITTTELYVAKRHEDIKEDEVTRTSHNAINVYSYDTRQYYYIAAEYYRELIIEHIKRNNK